MALTNPRRGEELGASLRKILLILAFTCGGFMVSRNHLSSYDSKWYFKTVWFLGMATTLVVYILFGGNGWQENRF